MEETSTNNAKIEEQENGRETFLTQVTCQTRSRKKIGYNKKFTLNSQDHEDDVIDLCLQSRNILLNMQKYISYNVHYNSEGNFFSYKIQS